MQPLGELLKGWIHRRGWSVDEFARRVGVSKGFPSNVANGHCPMPLKRVDKWIAELGLDQSEAKAFRIATGVTHVPPELRDELNAAVLFPSRAAEPSASYSVDNDTAQRERIANLTDQLNKVRDAMGLPPITKGGPDGAV